MSSRLSWKQTAGIQKNIHVSLNRHDDTNVDNEKYKNRQKQSLPSARDWERRYITQRLICLHIQPRSYQRGHRFTFPPWSFNRSSRREKGLAAHRLGTEHQFYFVHWVGKTVGHHITRQSLVTQRAPSMYFHRAVQPSDLPSSSARRHRILSEHYVFFVDREA